MNTFLNLQSEHTINWDRHVPSHTIQKLIEERKKAINLALSLPLNQRINNRGAREQGWGYSRNLGIANRVCKGTFHKGCRIYTKYDN